MLMYYFFLFN